MEKERGIASGAVVLPTQAELVREPPIKDVFLAVQNCNYTLTSLSTQFNHLREDVINMRQDMQKVRQRTSAVEGWIATLEDEMSLIQRDFKELGVQSGRYANRMDDLENRLRRNNVRILCIPERLEVGKPTEFIEHWLLEVFDKQDSLWRERIVFLPDPHLQANILGSLS